MSKAADFLDRLIQQEADLVLSLKNQRQPDPLARVQSELRHAWEQARPLLPEVAAMAQKLAPGIQRVLRLCDSWENRGGVPAADIYHIRVGAHALAGKLASFSADFAALPQRIDNLADRLASTGGGRDIQNITGAIAELRCQVGSGKSLLSTCPTEFEALVSEVGRIATRARTRVVPIRPSPANEPPGDAA